MLTIFKAEEDMSKYLLVAVTIGASNPILMREVTEPRYFVMTFGEGPNHGSTGLFVTFDVNQNLPLENYFSALDGDWAVRYANNVAAARGDTDDIGTFKAPIKVPKEDEVCWPRRDQNSNLREFEPI